MLTFSDPGPPAETMTPPDPAHVRLDPRLMTHQRMLDLVGDRMVRIVAVDPGQGIRPELDLYIDCAECQQGITAARPTSPVQFCADVLRHYVHVHGLSLAGGTGE